MAKATVHRMTLRANCTLTFPTPSEGRRFRLALVQDSTGNRTVTWPSTVQHAGGVPPTLSTGANKVDWFEAIAVDTATWFLFALGQDFDFHPVPFVTDQTIGTLRNNFTGRVGMRILVGSLPLTVTALGRWVVAGNSGSHALEILNNTTWTQVATVTVNTAGAPAGDYLYGILGAPVVLSAGTSYLVVSAETNGGDQFYNSNTTITFAPDATVPFPTFSSGASFSDDTATGGVNKSFGPVNFRYKV